MAKRGDTEQPKFDPWDVDLEQAVLGSLLVDNRLIDAASAILEPEDFYDPYHARVYEMIVHLQTEGVVTPVVLGAVMKSDPAFAEMHGVTYYAGLAQAAPSLPPIRQYCEILKDLAGRRGLLVLAEDLAHEAYLPPREAPTAALAEKATDRLNSILSGAKGHHKRAAVFAADAADAMLRRIEEQSTAAVQHGVSTGLDWLDKLIGGLFPGKLLVAAGRPSMGKSILATNIARAAARFIPVDYLCGEDGDELPARLATDIDFDRCGPEGLPPLKYGDFVHLKPLTESQFERFVLATGQLRELDLNIFDVSGMTLEWIEATCRRRAREKPGHRLVIIDHLQLVDWVAARRGANRNEIQTEITKRLQALAKELGFTILVLSQLSRDVEKREDKHPQLADLREGGSIEQDANVVIGIMRPLIYARAKIQAAHSEDQRHKAILEYDEAKDVVKIAVLKNKGGRTTEYSKLFIKPEASAIRDRAPETSDGAQTSIDWGKLAEDLA